MYLIDVKWCGSGGCSCLILAPDGSLLQRNHADLCYSASNPCTLNEDKRLARLGGRRGGGQHPTRL